MDSPLSEIIDATVPRTGPGTVCIPLVKKDPGLRHRRRAGCATWVLGMGHTDPPAVGCGYTSRAGAEIHTQIHSSTVQSGTNLGIPDQS